jgi:hypothetical protein
VGATHYALNVSDFQCTKDLIAYGHELSPHDALRDRTAVLTQCQPGLRVEHVQPGDTEQQAIAGADVQVRR